MKIRNTKLIFSIIGFLTGFSSTLIGMTAEDIRHNFSLYDSLTSFPHYIAPIIIGGLGGVIGYLFGSKRMHEENVFNLTKSLKNKYEQMLSNISDVIAIVNKDGLITYKSNNIKNHFGWKPGDLIKKPAWATVHPDDKEKVKHAFYYLIGKHNESINIEYRYLCKNGSYKWIYLSAINLINDNNINGILANYHDITKQKLFEEKIRASEYKYRNLFENMRDAICIIDNKKNLVNVNKASSRLYGYTKEELLKMNVADIVYKDDMDKSESYFRKLDEEGFYELYEGRVKDKDGNIKWIQVSSTAIEEAGVKIGAQDIIRDITERKKLEDSLRESKKTLSELNVTKDKFFSIIAHDLKGPLSTILTLSQILKKKLGKYSEEEVKIYVGEIHNSINQTFKLLVNLLDWATIQRGKMPYKPRKLNLLNLVNDQIDANIDTAKKKSIKIISKLKGRIICYADENMISLVLRNLIGNAIKFTEEKGIVEINATDNNDYIEVTIKDDGVGINKNSLTNLFKLGVRESTPGTNNEKGTGLGLILCKEFIDKHKGEIWADSEPGNGSTFYFTLPK